MRLPPLKALRAFEAAARHGGYIAAADELHVTRGAISRQIKVLEDHLGVPLFRRGARGVELNEAGRVLLPVLTDAFRRMTEGVAQVTQARAELRILCPPAKSIRWLHPRLGDFRARHPDISVQVTTDFYDRGGFDPTQFNVGFTVENWLNRSEEVIVVPLMPLIVTPACTPQIAATLGSPADIAQHRLLHETSNHHDWRAWLRRFPTPEVTATSGDVFHNLDMAVKAAELGAGIVMCDLLLCQEELKRGSLVMPFPDMTCDTPLGRFALMGHRDSWDEPAIQAFQAWVLEQSERDEREIFGS